MTHYFSIVSKHETGTLYFCVSNSSKTSETGTLLLRASRIDATPHDIEALYNSIPPEAQAKWAKMYGTDFSNIRIIKR